MDLVNGVGMTSQKNEMENNPVMFETTNQISFWAWLKPVKPGLFWNASISSLRRKKTPLQFHFISGSFMWRRSKSFRNLRDSQVASSVEHTKNAGIMRKLHPVENHNITTYIKLLRTSWSLDCWISRKWSHHVVLSVAGCAVYTLHQIIVSPPCRPARANKTCSYAAQQSMPSFKQRFSKTQKVE